MGLFCYTGVGVMNNIDMDGGNGLVEKRYNEERNLPCNFGGITLGKHGESVRLTTLDMLRDKIDNVGFIYCSAQGSESFIFSSALQFIMKHRPVIFFVNNKIYHRYQYEKIVEHYSYFQNLGEFDIIEYCINNLNYVKYYEIFNYDKYILLLPNPL